MPLDFPNSPGVGQTFPGPGGVTWTWDGMKWVGGGGSGGGGGSSSVVVSPTPPAAPTVGQLWWDSTGGQLYIRYEDPNTQQWVTTHNIGFGVPLTVQSGGTGIVTYSQGDLIYGSAPDTLARLTKSTAATRYLANTGASNNPAWDQVSLTSGVTGILPVANGGTGATTVGAAPFLSLTGGTLTGPLTGTRVNVTDQFNFADRTTPANTFSWYADTGAARLIASGQPDRMVVDRTTGNVAIAGNNLSLGTATLNATPKMYMDTGVISWQLGATNTGYNFYTNPGGLALNIDNAGNTKVAGSLTLATSGGQTNPTMTSAGPTSNWYTFIYAPDGSGLNSRCISIGSAGAGSTTYHNNVQHTFRNEVASVNYCAFNNTGTYNISGSWGTFSDETLKENITPYTRGLDAIIALEPINFNYIAGSSGFADGRPRFGLSAQQVEPIIPEIVRHTEITVGDPTQVKEGDDPLPTTEIMTLEPGNLIYVVINAIKELTTRVAALEGAP